jgi:hypothetical protein
LSPSGTLTVQFDAAKVAPEENITRTLELLIAKGVLVGAVTRGHKLEDRVLQLT